jgi:hypothetical protein
MSDWLAQNTQILTLVVPSLVATLGLLVGFKKHIDSQNQQLEFKKFEFITESLAQMSNKATTVQQQAFFVHELRNHPRYYEISAKIIKDFLSKTDNTESFFMEEAKETLAYIEKRI